MSLRVCTGEAFGLPQCKYAEPPVETPPKSEPEAKPSRPEPRPPSLLRRAANYGKAQIRHTANKRRKASPELERARLAVCLGLDGHERCPSLNSSHVCTERTCGCPVQKKTKWASERCPLDKWPTAEEADGRKQEAEKTDDAPPPLLRLPPASRLLPPSSIAVGITAAPRPDPTLARMVASTLRAGFSPTVYAEPGTDVEGLPCPSVVRDELQGPWRNWRLTLADLLAANPAAEALAIFQDDIVWCRNVRLLVETRFLWPHKCGVLSLYSPRHSWKGGAYKDAGGVHGINRHHLIGACAFVLPRAVAERLCTPEFATHHGGWDTREQPAAPHRKRAIEKYVRDAVTKMGLRCYYVAPSLAQHIGERSAIFPDNRNRRATVSSGRASRSFPGEEACAFEAHGLPFPSTEGLRHAA